jgi:hypothetical protein
LRVYETIVNLIAATTTAKGLKVTCRLDRRKYPIGREVTKEQMKQVNLDRNKFHGEWNYLRRVSAAHELGHPHRSHGVVLKAAPQTLELVGILR